MNANTDDAKETMYNYYKSDYPDFSDMLLTSMAQDHADMEYSFKTKEIKLREIYTVELNPGYSDEELEEMINEEMYYYKRNQEEALSDLCNIRYEAKQLGHSDDVIESMVNDYKNKCGWLNV